MLGGGGVDDFTGKPSRFHQKLKGGHPDLANPLKGGIHFG